MVHVYRFYEADMTGNMSRCRIVTIAQMQYFNIKNYKGKFRVRAWGAAANISDYAVSFIVDKYNSG